MRIRVTELNLTHTFIIIDKLLSLAIFVRRVKLNLIPVIL